MPALALGCAIALLAIWFGYPALMAAGGALARRRAIRPVRSRKPVSVIIATRDAPAVVESRVADVLGAGYPSHLLEVVVGLDAASTARAASMWSHDPRVRFVDGEAPGGKATALNAAVAASRGEILVFTDVAQRFSPGTIATLCDALGDERFGAVSGALHTGRPGAGRSLAELYWELEKWLRLNEGRVHSTVGVTGAVYAMRRDCWRPLPAGVILDDLYTPMDLVLRGWRVGFVPEATAFDERRFPPAQEFRRKARTLTGVIQLCAWLPAVLVPGRNPVWLQFVFHKLLRLATPYLLLVGLGALAAWGAWSLGATTPLRVLGLLAIVAAGAALLLAASRRLREGIGMVMAMQAAVMRATVNGLRGHWDVWSR